MSLISPRHEAAYAAMMAFGGRPITNGLLTDLRAAIATAARVQPAAVELVHDNGGSLEALVTCGPTILQILMPTFGRRAAA